jgi:hypothetical protein
LGSDVSQTMEEKENGYICCFKASSGAFRRNTDREWQGRPIANSSRKRERERER